MHVDMFSAAMTVGFVLESVFVATATVVVRNRAINHQTNDPWADPEEDKTWGSAGFYGIMFGFLFCMLCIPVAALVPAKSAVFVLGMALASVCCMGCYCILAMIFLVLKFKKAQ